MKNQYFKVQLKYKLYILAVSGLTPSDLRLI